jgi:hypothetical protein
MKRHIFIGITTFVLAAVLGACTPPNIPAASTQQGGGIVNTGANTAPQQAGGMQNVITVSGSGQAFGSPDIATVELGIEVRNEDVSQAITETNTAIDAITAALVDLGVAENDIQTTNFSVYQDERRNPQTGEPDGDPTFIVSNMVRVKVRDTSQISDVIDAGLSNGANRVFGLNFSLENPTELRNQAREAAVQDARTRAEALAEELGVGVGQVVYVSEGGGGGPVPVMDEDMALAGGGGPSINQGQLSVGVTVTVSYAIEY